MKIIDTGKKLPKARFSDLFELWENRKKLVVKPIMNQSRRAGTVIYGRHAVNKLLGRGYHRDTYDYDIYSGMPRSHALQLEQSIDRGTNSNLAFIQPKKIVINGKSKTVYRVKTRPHETTEADYSHKPKKLSFIVKNGVRYESLERADRKYSKMIKHGEVHRFPNAFFDKHDIDTFRLIRHRRI